MICNHASECNSKECQHKAGHPANDFCEPGHCNWGDTKCVAESKRELLDDLLRKYLIVDRDEAADKIEEIYNA